MRTRKLAYRLRRRDRARASLQRKSASGKPVSAAQMVWLADGCRVRVRP